ncbi:MAG: hypothetical protein DRJ61_13880 [Acidobacteria bacterium]|nr:MAG: hypothetical protein DRJ61_13880 [Acidobacteriota bacterium]
MGASITLFENSEALALLVEPNGPIFKARPDKKSALAPCRFLHKGSPFATLTSRVRRWIG